MLSQRNVQPQQPGDVRETNVGADPRVCPGCCYPSDSVYPNRRQPAALTPLLVKEGLGVVDTCVVSDAAIVPGLAFRLFYHPLLHKEGSFLYPNCRALFPYPDAVCTKQGRHTGLPLLVRIP